MVDNFDLIKPLFYFNEANNMFFFCQIVTRVKDHKEDRKKVKESAIKTYFITSREHLESLKEEIVMLCEYYGARAYINVSGKDFKKFQDVLLCQLAEYNITNTVVKPFRIVNRIAGTLGSRNPRWVIDIDDVSMKPAILDWLDNHFHVEEASAANDRESIYLVSTIPTVQGEHLITSPFYLDLFKEEFPDVDVHKNSMGTLLYYPKSLELPKYCCSICGGTNIQLQAWIDPNNNNRYIEDTEDDECWCEDCSNHTKLKEV